MASMLSRLRLRALTIASVAATMIGVSIGAAVPAHAATTIVNCPGDSLAAAISAASPGDTLVIGGTCTGNFVVNKKLTLQGATGATLDGGGAGTTLSVGATVKVKGLTITGGVGGVSPPDGGGIRNTGTLTLTGTVVEGNTANLGAGISNNGGTLTLTRSLVLGNSTTGGGFGAGVINNSALTIVDSTLRDNHASSAAGGGLWTIGHGTISGSTIEGNSATQGGGVSMGGSFSVINSTVSGNSSTTGEAGGILVWAGGMTMTSSTVSGNTAAGTGGGVVGGGGVTILQSSIVAGNSSSGGAADCAGSPASNGYNLIGDGDGCVFTPVAGDQVGSSSGSGVIDPQVGPLASNGGPTQTRALAPPSPAVNAIPVDTLGDDAATNLCPSTGSADQRGITRPQGLACDIGSFELQSQITFVSVDSGTSGSPATVSGHIACTGSTFALSVNLRQGTTKGLGSTSGSCAGTTPVGWTVSVSPGVFVPGSAKVNWSATDGSAKKTGKGTVQLT
jgi:nitrous oxidase accessory protein NosD